MKLELDHIDRALVYFAVGSVLGIVSMLIAYEYSLWLGFYVFIGVAATAIVIAFYVHYKNKLPEGQEQKEYVCGYCGETSTDKKKCIYCYQRR